jgi:hypothetical protein
MGVALSWVARITAVALLMFVPGVIGQYFDERLGTSFLTIIGFVFGLAAGMCCLLMLTTGQKHRNAKRHRFNGNKSP